MNTCGKCKQELRVKVPFCPFCGAAQDQQSASSYASKHTQNVSENKPIEPSSQQSTASVLPKTSAETINQLNPKSEPKSVDDVLSSKAPTVNETKHNDAKDNNSNQTPVYTQTLEKERVTQEHHNDHTDKPAFGTGMKFVLIGVLVLLVFFTVKMILPASEDVGCNQVLQEGQAQIHNNDTKSAHESVARALMVCTGKSLEQAKVLRAQVDELDAKDLSCASRASQIQLFITAKQLFRAKTAWTSVGTQCQDVAAVKSVGNDLRSKLEIHNKAKTDFTSAMNIKNLNAAQAAFTIWQSVNIEDPDAEAAKVALVELQRTAQSAQRPPPVTSSGVAIDNQNPSPADEANPPADSGNSNESIDQVLVDKMIARIKYLLTQDSPLEASKVLEDLKQVIPNSPLLKALNQQIQAAIANDNSVDNSTLTPANKVPESVPDIGKIIARNLSSAQTAIERRDFATARRYIQEVRRLDPSNARVNDLLTQIRNLESAAQTNSTPLQNATVTGTADRVSNLLLRAQDAMNRRDFALARRQIQEVKRLDLGNVRANDLLTQIRNLESAPQANSTVLQNATATGSGDRVNNLLQKAQDAINRREYGKAKMWVDEARRLDPGNVQANDMMTVLRGFGVDPVSQ